MEYRLPALPGIGRAIPEKDLLDPKRYPWMSGQPLLEVLQSSYEHHHVDHLQPLLALLNPLGNRNIAGWSHN